jgi:hypothetical protein
MQKTIGVSILYPTGEVEVIGECSYETQYDWVGIKLMECEKEKVW